MSDTVTKSKNVTESRECGDAVTASPRPWSVFYDEDKTGGNNKILDANGNEVVGFYDYEGWLSAADAALIVDAVNERDRLRDIVRRLDDALQGIMDAADGKGVGVLDEALLREARAAIGEDKP